MDDAKISEVCEWFEKWLNSGVYTEQERAFGEINKYEEYRAMAFYAGFRAAERLSKIEVLEELLSYRASFPIHAVMDGMLSKLKAGN